MNPASTVVAATGPSDALEGLYRRIAWRLMPLLLVCYVVNLIDRGNVGFAQLQMKGDLGFSDAVYGLGAGVFFIGYLLFELPSNLMLKRLGARVTLLRIMVLWGLVSAGMMFVQTPMQFYVLRFLLGAFEAGFFPGVVYFLTFWFPPTRRAKMVALFMTAAVISGVLSNPLSGWILAAMDSVGGWHGWQWMFLLEGLPAVLLGVVVFFVLPDTPQQARWLAPHERDLLLADLRSAPDGTTLTPVRDVLLRALKTPDTWTFALVGFCITFAAYFVGFWVPTMIRELGVSDLRLVGWYAAWPGVPGAIAMVWWGRRSDALNERRWHGLAGMGLAMAGLLAYVAASSSLWLALLSVSLISCGLICALPVFWALVTSRLDPVISAAAIALINSLANLAGAFSPSITGALKARSGNLHGGALVCVAVLLVGAGVYAWAARPRPEATS